MKLSLRPGCRGPFFVQFGSVEGLIGPIWSLNIKKSILTIKSDFFFLILSPLLVLNSRLYSEILRIKSDLSGFQKSKDYLKIAPKKFIDFI